MKNLLLIWPSLFLLARTALGTEITAEEIEKRKKYSVCFFPEKFVFVPSRKIEAIPVEGRLETSTMTECNGDNFNVELLAGCAEFALESSKKDINNITNVDLNTDSNNANKSNKKKKMVKFVKSLKEALSHRNRDAKKLEATLGNFYCVHAISACEFGYIDEETLKKIFVEFPGLVKNYLDHFANLEDYSFLTVELAEVIFAERNVLARPFALNKLIETVNVDVMVHLLEMWDYDLSVGDPSAVLNIWGTREEFLQRVEKDPRSWLLWRKVGKFKPFPIDLLLEILTLENIEMYYKLILAGIFENESIITSSLHQLEYLFADFHKNDFVEEKYMTSEMIAQLYSRKHDLWYEAGKTHFDMISQQMALKKRLISKLAEIKEANSIYEAESNINALLNLSDFLNLLKIPLNSLSRAAFKRSRDVDQVKAALDKISYHFPFYLPVVRPESLLNADFWTFLWKQIEVYEIEIVYDEALSSGFAESDQILELLLVSFYRNKKNHPKGSCGTFWYTQLVISAIDARTNPSMVMNCLLEFDKMNISDVSPYQMDYLRKILGPEVVEKDMKSLEVRSFAFDCFKFAPQLLEPDAIESLLRDPILRSLMKKKSQNITKLRFMDPFTAEDLVEFFPVGYNLKLEDCEALYTLKPDVLVDYLINCEGSINNPTKLVWQAHPDLWHDPKLTDVIGELIPFNAFLKHPQEAEMHNFINIATDIMGRLERRNESVSRQKLIIQWIVQMEWLYLQTYNNYFWGLNSIENANVYYNQIMLAEKRSRANLVTWLKSNDTLEDRDELLRLVTRTPLSNIRFRKLYEILMSEAADAINPTLPKKPTRPIPNFEVLVEKPLYQIRFSDVEKEISNAVAKCDELIDKHLGLIDGQIWKNRLKFVNFLTINKYTMNPISTILIQHLFVNNTALKEDLRVIATTLLRFGYLYAPGCVNTGEYLVPSEAMSKAFQPAIIGEEHEDMATRSILIQAETQKRLAALQKEKKDKKTSK